MLPALLFESLPLEVRQAFATLWPSAIPAVPELRRTISVHSSEVEKAALKNEFLDVTLSQGIAVAFERVLASWEELDSDGRRTIGAAVAYYALNEDAEDDLDSVLGFEDDAQVFNACARYIGRADLLIEIE